MLKVFKIFERKKESKTKLGETELRLINEGLIPRWSGNIPEGFVGKATIEDFRAFSAELKKSKDTVILKK